MSTRGNTCSFDCTYCQLGRTVHPLSERKEFITLTALAKELETAKGVPADCATFSGVGEPTLASNLGEAIILARSVLSLPVAVLTNSSLMSREDVRHDLAQADAVVAKIDAPNEELFQEINRPGADCSFDGIIESIRPFRGLFTGKLALQMMFIEQNRACAQEMAELARQLRPDEAQLNTPLRPSPVKPLEPGVMANISRAFTDFSSLSVYDVSRPTTSPLDWGETSRRRPS